MHSSPIPYSLIKNRYYYKFHKALVSVLFLMLCVFMIPEFLSHQVKKCEKHLTILVIDSRSEEIYNRMGIPIIPAFAKSHNLPYRPKTLHLTQGPQGYGFLLRQEKLRSGRIGEFY